MGGGGGYDNMYNYSSVTSAMGYPLAGRFFNG